MLNVGQLSTEMWVNPISLMNHVKEEKPRGRGVEFAMSLIRKHLLAFPVGADIIRDYYDTGNG